MRVFELYSSIQGETQFAGLPCTLIRFAGCDLRCSYCDTSQAFTGGADRSIDDIVDDVHRRGITLVLLTGGEPMLQRDIGALAQRLLDTHMTVMIETSGAHDVSRLPRDVVKILDIKTPGSGESQRMDWENLGRIDHKDAVKFVLTGQEDYRFAQQVIGKYELARKAQLLLSPVFGQLDPRELVAWMLRDRLPARLNLQLHKVLWGADATGV